LKGGGILFQGYILRLAIDDYGLNILTNKPFPTVASGKLGGDGGESNSPSRRSCPEHATSLVSSLILLN